MSTTFLNLKIFFSLKSFFRQYEHMFLFFFLRFAAELDTSSVEIYRKQKSNRPLALE